jgi:hypothetical protein
VKELSDVIYEDKYFINRNKVGLRKIITNAKGKEKIEIVYPIINGKYFNNIFTNNGNQTGEFTHCFISYVFEDNDDI